jgi:hypothetical protein
MNSKNDQKTERKREFHNLILVRENAFSFSGVRLPNNYKKGDCSTMDFSKFLESTRGSRLTVLKKV